ncbi:MAG: hypothetical protein HRT98_02820 [Mycoplasmatales bacterium]|nr:hypothetical protein [Mycoplasmatales bacterium]
MLNLIIGIIVGVFFLIFFIVVFFGWMFEEPSKRAKDNFARRKEISKTLKTLEEHRKQEENKD